MKREEAIQIIRKANHTDKEMKALEILIPELRESENEEIYREIYSIVHCYYKRKANLLVSSQDRNEMREKWEKAKSFLEKQERKPSRHSNNTLEDVSKEFREKNQPLIESISDELVDIIKGEFEGFRTLLKKNGIDYEPQRSYWEGFARLFDSSAREYVKEQKQEIINISEMVSKYSNTDEYDVDGNRIGKPVICMIRAYKQGICDTLSKVKEQKPIEWSNRDKFTINSAIYWLERRLRIEKANNLLSTTGCHLSMRETVERLQSLCPQSKPSWKPSEEQMKALKNSAYSSYQNGDGPLLRELYNDLLKQK